MTNLPQKKHIAILGSTGSIGTQALDVIERHRELFEVELLTANHNSSLLAEQALKFNARKVAICDDARYDELASLLSGTNTKVYSGIQSVCDILSGEEKIDIVLTAMVGFSGLKPTIASIEAGRTIALANKETLVAAGSLISRLAAEHNVKIIPVDSEHSAIYQCLNGEDSSEIEKILLTGSGGPFLNASKEEIFNAGIEQALNHPRLKMGAKVTIDSASLMNKGLELIEARWLFNIQPENIEVVIHPQSIIHSMVQFKDGAVMAQLGSPDMRIPIQYALAYPKREYLNSERIDFAKLAQMTFFKPDLERFPCLGLAYKALSAGGNMTCIMNAANEMAVKEFMNSQIQFGEIPQVISETMERAGFMANPSFEDIFCTNFEAAQIASDYIKSL